MKLFSTRILHWQRTQGRHDLPWQCSDPYRIWVSEIMLQQTQVATVIPYFERFIVRFPDLASLAAAHEDTVLALWSGLGYYSRARNLHAAACTIVREHGGQFPVTAAELIRLPGIGRSTAAAIAALAFGERAAILDGNVKRVLARHVGVAGWPGEKSVETQLWKIAEARLPATAIGIYTQGMMDLGATVCTRAAPHCDACPVRGDCVALAQQRVADYPAARPRRGLPEKHTQLLLCRYGNQLLLEKRPSRGIWGGLWSLPELDVACDAADHSQQTWGSAPIRLTSLPPLAHSFTHFRLHIQPVQLDFSSRPDPAHAQRWHSLSDALDAALPAPVRVLLQQNFTI